MEKKPRYTRVRYDLDRLPHLTSPRRQLDLEAVALGLIRIPAGDGYTFTHRHARQEEVYVVVGGRVRLLVDGELVDLRRGDVVRVSPEASRALAAHAEDALLVVCAGAVPAGYPSDPGARYLIDDGVPDYDDVPPWCADDPHVRERNTALKDRMRRARERRERRGEGGPADGP